ncbi:immunoglobulin-like fold-containing [Desulfonema limicola]|uniref:Immunoglobulin-like fold-containing n=1 Tax=Desulfonema limicola TaxID=45656 RepID=A0A975GHP1_9BACT|nr:fibronectin type III domain-containing protein [Desulfonema limicola]QTA81716.1 immunoglobulin-like fold-containing [Desulfonema limicola]
MCPSDPEKMEPGICGCGVPDTDRDGDNLPDCKDACPDDPGKTEQGVCGCGVSEIDTDKDGMPDCKDQCPGDPAKTEPGVCGCGVSDKDENLDGIPDCEDQCPDDPDKMSPGICGCGVPDADKDKDGILDCKDECPDDPNKSQPGACGCGTPDTDKDGDGILDCKDECPDDPNKSQPEVCGCGIADTDSDQDGIPDCNDMKTIESPVLIFPENNQTDTDLTPILKTNPFSSTDPLDFHVKTQWQISMNPDFSSPVMDLTHTQYLTSLKVPALVLKADTEYFLRVRFFSGADEISIWSDTYSFTTSSSIINSREPDLLSDLDKDGMLDNEQPDIKSLETKEGSSKIGVKWQENISDMEELQSMSTYQISGSDRPVYYMPYGLAGFRLKIDKPGSTVNVIIYFSKSLPENAGWEQYDSIRGWQDYMENVKISSSRSFAELEFTDGGYGDADGTENSVIVHVSGPSNLSLDQRDFPTELPGGDPGGIGCFINMLKQ